MHLYHHKMQKLYEFALRFICAYNAKFVFPTCPLQPRLKVINTDNKLYLEIFEITGSNFPLLTAQS